MIYEYILGTLCIRTLHAASCCICYVMEDVRIYSTHWLLFQKLNVCINVVMQLLTKCISKCNYNILNTYGALSCIQLGSHCIYTKTMRYEERLNVLTLL